MPSSGFLADGMGLGTHDRLAASLISGVGPPAQWARAARRRALAAAHGLRRCSRPVAPVGCFEAGKEEGDLGTSKRVGPVALTLLGLVLGLLIGWVAGRADGTRIQVVEGQVWVNEAATAVGLSPDGRVPAAGYLIAGAMWREQAGPWHDTFPTCLEPLVADQRVRLGILETRPQGDAPGRPVVVWLECLEADD